MRLSKVLFNFRACAFEREFKLFSSAFYFMYNMNIFLVLLSDDSSIRFLLLH